MNKPRLVKGVVIFVIGLVIFGLGINASIGNSNNLQECKFSYPELCDDVQGWFEISVYIILTGMITLAIGFGLIIIGAMGQSKQEKLESSSAFKDWSKE